MFQKSPEKSEKIKSAFERFITEPISDLHSPTPLTYEDLMNSLEEMKRRKPVPTPPLPKAVQDALRKLENERNNEQSNKLDG